MAPLQLTSQQVEKFQKNGYLVLREEEHGLVDADSLQQWTNEVRNWPRVQGKWMPYDEVSEDGQRQLMRTEKYADYHEGFGKLLLGEDVAQLLKQLSNDDMLLFKDKINYKLPHGNGFAAHLDAPAYDHIGQIEHLTANFAVDATTPENGCLEVVPGSHLMKVDLSHGGAISKTWEDSHKWTPVPLQSGDVLLFGSHLAHRSARNNTKNSRSSVYATYHGKKDGLDLRRRYYEDRRANFPPDHERDMNKDYGEGWKRYGFAAPYTRTKEEYPVAQVVSASG